MFPAVPVPIFIVFELFPVPRFIDPVVPLSRVSGFAPVDKTEPAPVKLRIVPPMLKLFATPVTELRVAASCTFASPTGLSVTLKSLPVKSMAFMTFEITTSFCLIVATANEVILVQEGIPEGLIVRNWPVEPIGNVSKTSGAEAYMRSPVA